MAAVTVENPIMCEACFMMFQQPFTKVNMLLKVIWMHSYVVKLLAQLCSEMGICPLPIITCAATHIQLSASGCMLNMGVSSTYIK